MYILSFKKKFACIFHTLQKNTILEIFVLFKEQFYTSIIYFQEIKFSFLYFVILQFEYPAMTSRRVTSTEIADRATILFITKASWRPSDIVM